MNRILTLTSFLVLTAPLRATDSAPTPDQINFFEKNIRPVLAAKCYDCHSAKAGKVKGGLLLDTRDGLLRGGDSGTVVVPEKPGESHCVGPTVNLY